MFALTNFFETNFYGHNTSWGAKKYSGLGTIARFFGSSASGAGTVADTFWSVHIKCCFHKKKTKSKRPTTNIKSAERQRKGRDQSSTKNVTSKTSRLHKVAKQHKASNRSVGNSKTNCMQTKSDKI